LIYNINHREENGVLPRGLKSYPTPFMRFPYYEHLTISHLFDIMDVENNVTKTFWQIIDGRRDKEKILKIFNDVVEANQVMKSGI